MKTVETKYYDNGNKKSEIERQNGKLHGRYQAWYENGQQQDDSYYINGKKHGRYQLWYKDGTQFIDDYYINGYICSKAEWDEHSRSEE